VGVLQAGDDFNFLEEPVGAECADDLRPKHFDRDLTRMLQVLREIDGGHAAPPELALDRVAVRYSSPE
jgi:hypothetical protein